MMITIYLLIFIAGGQMRKNRTETAESRRHILEQASRLFRERGPERVSLTDVMNAAGMTHGGFYKHFASKDALFADTLAASFEEKIRYLAERSSDDPGAALRSYLEGYLTVEHVEDRSWGCPIAGSTSDALRASPEAAVAMAKGAEETLDYFTTALGSDAAAIRTLAMAIGAVILARAVQNDSVERILETAFKAVEIELNCAGRARFAARAE